MNIIKLELTEQEAKIYDEVMEQIEKTAAFLVGLSHEERLDWLREHQYSLPRIISFRLINSVSAGLEMPVIQ